MTTAGVITGHHQSLDLANFTAVLGSDALKSVEGITVQSNLLPAVTRECCIRFPPGCLSVPPSDSVFLLALKVRPCLRYTRILSGVLDPFDVLGKSCFLGRSVLCHRRRFSLPPLQILGLLASTFSPLFRRC